MTIQFNCPNCNSLIAFDSRHSGKHAQCHTCGQKFIIPFESNVKPKKIKPQLIKTDPIPGFYRAVLLDNFKLFFDRQNITPLAFVVACVCFKFFTYGLFCCGFVTYFVAWGWLFGLYLNIIYNTAFDEDTLPEIYLGTSITFLWYIIRPFLVFTLTMVVVLFPFIITLAIANDRGITPRNMWTLDFGLPLLMQLTFILGLFLFPIAILTVAVGKDITLLRPDYFFAAILKAFMPYVVVVLLLLAAAVLEIYAPQFSIDAPIPTTAAHLAINLAVQILAIFSMRAIGLFFRHYSCHVPWEKQYQH